MLLPKHLSMTRLLAYLLVTAHDAGQTTTITLITAILAPVLPHLGWLLCSIVHHAAITLRRPDVPAALIANLLPAHPSPTQPSSALLSTLTASLLKASRHPEAVARTLDAASHLDDVDVQHLVGAVLPALVQCLANTRTAAHVAAVSIHLLQLGNEQALTTMACALLDAEQFQAAGALMYAACTLPGGDALLTALTVRLLEAQHAWHAARAVAVAAVGCIPTQQMPKHTQYKTKHTQHNRTGSNNTYNHLDTAQHTHVYSTTNTPPIPTPTTTHPGAALLMAQGMAGAAVAAVDAGYARALAHDIAPVLCASGQGRQLASALAWVLDGRGQQHVLGVLCVHMLQGARQVMKQVGLQLLHDGHTSTASHTVIHAVRTPGYDPDVLSRIAAEMLVTATLQGLHTQLLEVSDRLGGQRTVHPLLRAIVLQAHAQGGMEALVSLAGEGLKTQPHTLQVLAGVLISDPACHASMAALTGQLAGEPKQMSRVVQLALALLQRAPLEGTEQHLAALAHTLVLDRHITLLRHVTLTALEAKQGALLILIGNTCVDHGHHVVVWALTFDLVYYASEDKVAALGAQLAAAGAPEGLLDTLVRPLVDLVAAGRQHALARVTKILVDRYQCAWFVERVAECLLREGHADIARALTPQVLLVGGVGPLAKVGARLAKHPKALLRLAAT